MLLARAVGIHNQFFMNVRAVVVNPLGPGKYGLEVVMSVPSATAGSCTPVDLVVGRPTAATLAKDVVNDPEIQAMSPDMEISGYQMLELTGPAGAVDYWRAHQILWDKQGSNSPGIPTAAYGAASGAYLGEAEAAPNLKKWLPSDPPLDPGAPKAAGLGVSGTDALWVGGAIAAVWLGAKFFDSKRARAGARP